jgi:hypothetical protein
MASIHWGSAAALVVKVEGREGGGLAGFGLGLPSFPSIQPDMTRSISVKISLLGFAKICW